MLKIQKLIENLLFAEQKDNVEVRSEEELFKVNVMTSTVASFYEKLRTFIDYKDEHLLRKNAIFRILKRRFLERGDIAKVSENMIKELISAGYLPNNQIPESMKLKVAEVISKYQLLFDEIQERKGFFKEGLKQYSWLLGIAAVEIEDLLALNNQEKVYIQFLYKELNKRLEINYSNLDDKAKDLQLYLAANRTFIKSDRSMINYFLLRLFYTQWILEYEKVIPYIAEHIDEVKESLEEPINNKLNNKIIKQATRYATMVHVLKGVIEDEETQKEKLTDSEYLTERITQITLAKYKIARRKIRKSISTAIVYIFLTKMALALAIEVPLDKLFYGHVSGLSIFINITVPVLLMIIVALSISTPGKKNTEAMVEGVHELLLDEPVKIERINEDKKRSFTTRFLFNAIYFVAFAIPFYIIIKILAKINFSPLSMLLFLVFLSIVSFFGVRIRHQAKELEVIKKKETFITELFDFFTLPIIRLGGWLSLNFSKVNVFAIFLDIIIEAPLKLVLQVLDDWFGFVKEKKDNY